MKVDTPIKYMVCVRSITYNQSEFVTDTMDGFCAQRSKFPYVCVIIDDASTDGEQNLIYNYIDNYFNRCEPPVFYQEETDDYILVYAQHKKNENCFFAVFFLKYNHYSINKDKTPYFEKWQDNSKYIAFCEGDDYWIDTHKLQRQVNFMDTHPDYTLFFHNAIVRYENHDYPDKIMRAFETGDYNTRGIFEKWHLPLASVLCKREIMDEPLLVELNKVFEGGFCFFITATKTGKVYGLSECLSVYRKNVGGVSNLMSEWEILKRHYGYARLTEDASVLEYVDDEAFRRLIKYMPRYLLRNEGGKKMADAVKHNNKKVFYKALLLYPFLLPGIIYDKLKNKIHGKENY